jgi:predicted DNA-binding transcriptional regulator AlpA
MSPTAEESTPLTTIPSSLKSLAADVLTAVDIAARLQCSVRYVWRMNDAGLMPPSFRIGRLVRWQKAIIDSWISDGCPPCRKAR